MSSSYAAAIAQLAPDHDPAHVEAWMRLKHPTLDGLDAAHFAREVDVAISCITTAGLQECDELAHSFGLRPRARTAYQLHDRVLVARDGGLQPAEAQITAENEHRPHLVKVLYAFGTGAWIARARIVGPAAARPRPADGR